MGEGNSKCVRGGFGGSTDENAPAGVGDAAAQAGSMITWVRLVS
jgi:hypothetical protein